MNDIVLANARLVLANEIVVGHVVHEVGERAAPVALRGLELGGELLR